MGWCPRELMALPPKVGVSKGNASPTPPKGAPAGCVWKLVKMTVDSGACDHVMNPDGEDISPRRLGLIKPTAASVAGVEYGSASGHSLVNEGEASKRRL